MASYISSFDFCMRRKCKDCPRTYECEYLNRKIKLRLLFKPFENINEYLRKADDKKR